MDLTFFDNVWHFCDTDTMWHIFVTLVTCDIVWHYVTLTSCDIYLCDIGYMWHCMTFCDTMYDVDRHHVTHTDLCSDRNLLDDPTHHNRLVTETQHKHIFILYTQVPDDVSFSRWPLPPPHTKKKTKTKQNKTPYIYNGIWPFTFFLVMKQIENQLTAGANGCVHNTLCVLGHILLNSTGQFSVYWFQKK